jgi:hypothetical protein
MWDGCLGETELWTGIDDQGFCEVWGTQAHRDRWQQHPRAESGGDDVRCITHSHHRCHLEWCRLAWAAGDPSDPAFSLLYLPSPLCPSSVPEPLFLVHLHQGLPPSSRELPPSSTLSGDLFQRSPPQPQFLFSYSGEQAGYAWVLPGGFRWLASLHH